VAPLQRSLAILCLVAFVACARQTPGVTPAATPEATVGQFLAAVNANDLERMAALFGDERGRTAWGTPAARQERLAIMQHVLKADSSRILGAEPDTSGATSRRVLHVELIDAVRRVTVPFVVARQNAGGWLVFAIGLAPLMPSAPAGRRGS